MHRGGGEVLRSMLLLLAGMSRGVHRWLSGISMAMSAMC